jgi:hypothetical protein
MIAEALAAPARTEDAAVTVAVGGALLALSTAGAAALVVALSRSPGPALFAPLVVVPGLVLLGYEVRVVRAGVEGARATPSFVDWSGLLRGGLASAALAVGYLLPGLVVAAGAVGAGVAVDAGVLTRVPWSVPAGGVVAVLAVGANALAAFYLRPAGLAVYAATGSLAAAFSPGAVLGVAASGRYVLGWALATGGLAVGTVAASPLAAVLVGFPLVFYVRAVAHSVYGRAAADAVGPAPETGVEGGPPAAATEPPAAVQTGRDVPLDAGSGGPVDGESATRSTRGAGGGDAAGPGDPEPDDGFEWGRPPE